MCTKLHDSLQDFTAVYSEFVLPDPHNPPAFGSEGLLNVLVPILIFLNLFSPEFSVSVGDRTATSAAMPKATVQENCKARSGENDIRAARKPRAMSESPSLDTGAH